MLPDDPKLLALLPHRRPMLQLDGAAMPEEGVVEAYQRIPSADDPILASHFPGAPIWPGVMLVEAMGQATAICLLAGLGPLEDGEMPLLGAVNVRFLAPVSVGEIIRFETRLVRRIGKDGLFSVTARRDDGEVVVRGQISAAIRPAISIGSQS